MANPEPQHIIGDRSTWRRAARPGERGPLVAVEISKGRFVKMYEQDAIAQGLLRPAEDEGKTSHELNEGTMADGEETDPAGGQDVEGGGG